MFYGVLWCSHLQTDVIVLKNSSISEKSMRFNPSNKITMIKIVPWPER